MFKLKNSKINYIDLLCVAFLLTFPLIILIIGNMAPTYYINDDFYLKQIVSGQFTGTPNAYLFHMGYLFGLVVSILYKLLPAIPWYDFFMFSFIYVGIILSISLLLKYVNKVWQKLLLTGIGMTVMYGFFFSHLLQLQFTTISAVVCVASMVYFYNVKDETHIKSYLCHQIPSFILFGISYQLRDTACIMFLPLLFFLGLSRLLQNKKMFKPLLAYGSILLGILLVLIGIDKLAYSSEDWRTYKEYSENRALIVDYEGYPSYEDNTELYDSLGISEASYVAITTGYSLLLDENIDADFMKTIAEISYKKETDLAKLAQGFLTMHIEPHFDWPINRMVFLLYGMTIVMALLSAKFKALLDVVAIIMGRMIIWVYLLYIGRPIFRVTQGVYIAELLLLASVFCYHKLWKPKEDKRRNLLTALLAMEILGILLISVRWGFAYTKEIAELNVQTQEEFVSYEEVMEYLHTKEENFYMLDVWSFASYRGGVFAKPSENATNTVVLGGWTANSPWTDEIAANNGFSAFEVIARENDNVFFVFKNTEKTQYTYLAEYYAQKYPGTTLEVCDKFTSTTGEEFIILRCNK